MTQTTAHPLKSYNVPFEAMEPAIAMGSDVIGDISHYSKHKPTRWDIVAFFKDANSTGRFVKRIVGLPGETIRFSHKGIEINGAPVAVPVTLKGRFSSFSRHEDHKFGSSELYKIPADSVFVIGDNSEVHVTDSREFGPVPIRNLEARIMATVRVTPVT